MKRTNSKAALKKIIYAFCFSIAMPVQFQTVPAANAAEAGPASGEKLASMTQPESKTQKSAQSQTIETEADAEFEEPDEPGVWTPVHGIMTRSGASKTADCIRIDPGESKLLVGSIDISDGDPVINSQVKVLTDTAAERSSKMIDAKKAFDHFNTAHSKAAVKSKDTLNILIAYRGFASSKEAGDIILDEDLRLNGLPASELAIQKELDRANSSVVQCLMQIAMGMGLKEPDAQMEVVTEGFKKLSALVGEESAQNSVTTISSWNRRLKVPEKIYKTSLWSPSEQQQKLSAVIESAQTRDPYVSKVTKKIHGYNKKSKVAMAAGHVIEGGLGIACLVPSAVGPAAQVALTGFEMATGGSEENKLLKQIYLSKRLDSRNNLLKEKATLALQNYQIGMLSRNPSLLAFSEALVAEMAGDDAVRKVFGQSIADLKQELQAKAQQDPKTKSN